MAGGRGKNICEVLKQVRHSIAVAHGIAYSPRECDYKGDCSGTCPACEAETRYLENSLKAKYGTSFATKVAGMALALGSMGLAANAQQPTPESCKVYNNKQVVENGDSLAKQGYTLIRGQVIDSDNEPLIGAIVENGKFGTLTDIDGYFDMYVKKGDKLEIKFIGYINLKVPYKKLKLNELNVFKLEEDPIVELTTGIVG